jgi:alpha-tubulin suppressor-like RCC1 family protein
MPMRLANAASLRRFALGTSHSCAFDDYHQVFCWGENAQGQLGLGDTQPRDEPTPVQ